MKFGPRVINICCCIEQLPHETKYLTDSCKSWWKEYLDLFDCVAGSGIQKIIFISGWWVIGGSNTKQEIK